MTVNQSAAPAQGCPFGHSASAEQAREATFYGYEPFKQENPFPSYATLRQSAPIFFDERTDLWVVSRYDDIKEIFSDWETFSSENAQAPIRERGPQATQIMKDGGFTAYSGLSARVPPEHTRIRAIAQKAFTPRRFKKMEPTIRENIVSRIDAMLANANNQGDIFSDLAYEVPTITILTLIGADLDMLDDFKRWSDSRAAMTWSDLTDEEQIPHAHNLVEYWQECQRLVQMNIENPGDNLVADILSDREDGAEISDHEIASLLYSMLFAGHETTTTLISNAVRVLGSHNEQWQMLVDDPKKIPAAIDEVLRVSGSIVGWRRKATKDTVVAGAQIKAGDGLLLLMGSANRDEAKFDNPEEFDITRANAREHLSFGYGIHYCLGNMLAKLQTKIAIEELVRLVPTLSVVSADRISFRNNISFRVPETVPVTWEA